MSIIPSGKLALQFQFNPETVTRTRAGQWDPRVKRQQTKIPPNPEVRGEVAESWGRSHDLTTSRSPSMVDILNLALPFFGVIFIGFACGNGGASPTRGWRG